jgi:hypothetical protein
MDFVGWSALSPTEQLAAISGGVAGLGLSMTLRTLFGGLRLHRTKPKSVSSGARKSTVRPKAKRKPAKRRR